MIRKTLLLTPVFLFVFSLLSGCGLFDSITGGACYYENRVRHDLPTQLSQPAPSPKAFNQKQLTMGHGDKVLNKDDLPVAFDGDIYIAGHLPGRACYWKNGVITDLEENAQSEDIFIEGDNIYVSGCYYDGSGQHACYWVNGIRHDLLGGDNAAVIFVKDGIVYATWGRTVYWANGVRHQLDSSFISDIYVDENNNVYVAGGYEYKEGYCKACYWKNDILYPLDSYGASSIVARNSVVYVAACDGNSQVRGMCVNGSDVYIAGSYEYEEDPTNNYWTSAPCYWKNGELIPLLLNQYGEVQNIAVSGDDVLVTGYGDVSDKYSQNTLWINGQPVDLGDIRPYGLFVVPHSI